MRNHTLHGSAAHSNNKLTRSFTNSTHASQMADMHEQLQHAQQHAQACQDDRAAAEAGLKSAQQAAERWQEQCEALRKRMADATSSASEQSRAHHLAAAQNEEEAARLRQREVRTQLRYECRQHASK